MPVDAFDERLDSVVWADISEVLPPVVSVRPAATRNVKFSLLDYVCVVVCVMVVVCIVHVLK